MQPPDPTGQTVAAKKNRFTSLTGAATALSEELDSDGEHFSDNASPSRMDEEGKVSDLESTAPDHKEVLDVDHKVSVEQTYRETVSGVRLFVGWDQIFIIFGQQPLCWYQNTAYW